MKTPQEKRAKAQRIKEKLAIRQVGKTVPKEKKGATGELELFKSIALQRCSKAGIVLAMHITSDGEFIRKPILIDHLTPTNFSHIKPKGMYPELRLDPDNIEIVSRAYHEWQHTRQIAQVNYPN